jgi:hypothetical protein
MFNQSNIKIYTKGKKYMHWLYYSVYQIEWLLFPLPWLTRSIYIYIKYVVKIGHVIHHTTEAWD